MIGVDELEVVIARELALIEDPARREGLRALRVAPRREVRPWNYGAPGQTYPCWVVAQAPDSGTMLVYAEQGFGPEFPWGFLPADGPLAGTLGMDVQWNWYLEEAFVRSGLWAGPVKPGLEEAFHQSPEERFRADQP